MGIKDALKKLKPQEQSCCSVEIEEKTDKKDENSFNNINQNIQNIAYLINNPKKVRTEDDLDE